MHALVIEDAPLIAMLIEDELRPIGYSSVALAVTEIEAVEAAQDHVPDMITSDVRLAEACGISAVEAICRSGKVPVVFITGWVDCANDPVPDAVILTKPFAASELERALITAKAVTP